jgi:hypothetical protein
MVGMLAAGRAGKRGMRLVADARPDVDDVVGEGDACWIGVVRQRAPLGVEIARLRHGLGRARNQRIGPLQVVVLQGRLVNLRREVDLVLAVGLHGIEMFGAVGEGAVKNIAAPIRRRIGVVPGAAACREQQAEKAGKQAAHAVQFSRSAIIRCWIQPRNTRWDFSLANAS